LIHFYKRKTDMTPDLLLKAFIGLSNTSLPISNLDKNDSIPPYQTTLQLISQHGYPSEEHTVVSDGYSIHLHRITNPSANQGVVLLNHGFLADSACWVYGDEFCHL